MATNARTTVVVIDVNVWMGLEMDGMKHYNNIIAWTKEAVMLSGLPIERTVLMMKTLYECGDEGSWHCERNNELIRRAGEANGVSFDFAAIFKNKGLDPKTALRTDGIHQMPDTALYEMYNMLEFVQQRFIGGNVSRGSDGRRRAHEWERRKNRFEGKRRHLTSGSRGDESEGGDARDVARCDEARAVPRYREGRAPHDRNALPPNPRRHPCGAKKRKKRRAARTRRARGGGPGRTFIGVGPALACI